MNEVESLLRVVDAAEAGAWFEVHRGDTDRAWIVIAKKGSKIATPSNAELLDLALAYGWIDGQRKLLEDDAYRQPYGTRRSRQGRWAL